MPDEISTRVSRWNSPRRLAAVLLLLLIVPASDALPLVRWNLHVWGRLRRENRVAPDHDLDVEYRRLTAHLPPRGVVGLLGGGATQAEASRFHYFLQYALAPRVVVLTTDAEFVIALVWPPEGDDPLPADTFVRLAGSGSGLRVYRRARP